MTEPRKKYRLSKMIYDEVSLVDAGANQHAHVLIYKRDESADDVSKANDSRLQHPPKLGMPSQRNPTAFNRRGGAGRGSGVGGKGGSGSKSGGSGSGKSTSSSSSKKTAAAKTAAAKRAARLQARAAAHQRALAAHQRAVARKARNHAKSAGKHKVGLGRGKGFKWVDDSAGYNGIVAMATATLHKADTGGTWILPNSEIKKDEGTWLITKSILTPSDVHNDGPLKISQGPRMQRVGGPQKTPKKPHHAKTQLRHYNGKWIPTGPHVNGTSKTPAMRRTQ